MGGAGNWESFELLWLDATNRLKGPFRSTDCETLHGEFSSWSKADSNVLMASLVRLIARSGLGCFASIVPVADYRSVFSDAREYDPYFLALKHVFVMLGESGSKMDAGIKCWGEESQVTSAKTRQVYLDLKNTKTWEGRHFLTGFEVLDKRHVPLQAADLVARESFKHISNLGIRPERKPVKIIGKFSNFKLWTREMLEYLKGHGGQDNLGLLTSWTSQTPRPPAMRVFAPARFG
jgi:hypothetical protein